MKGLCQEHCSSMTTNKLNKLYKCSIAFSPNLWRNKRSYKGSRRLSIHYCGGDPVVCNYLLSIYESVYEKLQLQVQF